MHHIVQHKFGTDHCDENVVCVLLREQEYETHKLTGNWIISPRVVQPACVIAYWKWYAVIMAAILSGTTFGGHHIYGMLWWHFFMCSMELIETNYLLLRWCLRLSKTVFKEMYRDVVMMQLRINSGDLRPATETFIYSVQALCSQLESW